MTDLPFYQFLLDAMPLWASITGAIVLAMALAFVGVSEDGKASVAIGVTDDLKARLSAVDLVRAASEALGGKGGGGRADMAQAGGPDGDKADAAIDAVAAAIG